MSSRRPPSQEKNEQTPLILKQRPGVGKDIERQQYQNATINNEVWNIGDCNETEIYYPPHFLCTWQWKDLICTFLFALMVIGAMSLHWATTPPPETQHNPTPVFQKATGPYKLIKRHVGKSFFDHYKFYDGSDSLGSGGHQVYVSRERASELGLFYVSSSDNSVIMKSAPTSSSSSSSTVKNEETLDSAAGKRESIRLEGIHRYDRGLFVLDLDHMPTGAGVWPAFWMTDEANWPDHGEIDIVEPINHQTQAKVALHTGGQCRMYGQVPSHAYTGTWDRATGIPDPATNKSNYQTDIEADDCWNLAAHRWYNQGCVLVDNDESSIGKPFNDNGGGIYALEWDPENGYIKSWSFPRHSIPSNLERAIKAASGDDKVDRPNPSQWGLPYAYYAIGPNSDCSSDHFQNMRLVFNLAFCGEVAGQRFFKDCPDESSNFNISNHPVDSCNAYIESNPQALEDEAYWKIRGVYTWERELQMANFTEVFQGEQDDKNAFHTSSSNKKKDVGPQR